MPVVRQLGPGLVEDEAVAVGAIRAQPRRTTTRRARRSGGSATAASGSSTRATARCRRRSCWRRTPCAATTPPPASGRRSEVCDRAGVVTKSRSYMKPPERSDEADSTWLARASPAPHCARPPARPLRARQRTVAVESAVAPGDDVDGAAEGVGAEQRRPRPVQHLDSLHRVERHGDVAVVVARTARRSGARRPPAPASGRSRRPGRRSRSARPRSPRARTSTDAAIRSTSAMLNAGRASIWSRVMTVSVRLAVPSSTGVTAAVTTTVWR